MLGTYDEPGVVTVPRRMAPRWMLDENGEVRPELAGDYVVKGRRGYDGAQAERDRIDAFANHIPEV
mgnify:FL=1